MKKLILSVAVLSLALCVKAQINPIGGVASNVVANLETTNLLFTTGEVTLEVGGVYVQKTGEGGEMLDVAKWDVFGIQGLGVGGQVINTSSDLAAEFGYFGYRHCTGNAALEGFAGFGYNEIDRRLMGIIGVGIEYRTSKNIGAFTKTGYGIEPHGGTKRGLVVAAGVSYSF